jgi:NifU-like protein
VHHELESEVICTCFGITEKEIEEVVRENSLTTVEQVTNYTKAGGGCGGCKDDIARIIARVTGRQPEEAPSPRPAGPLTNIQKIKLIEETINREIRPALRQDGGDIELIDVVDSRVFVSFRGSCAHCRVAEFTKRHVVEARLKEFVADDIVVEEVQS